MPIITDYSGIVMSSMFSQKSDTLNEDLIRHQVLNTLRMYNVKYRAKFGKMIIACDGGSWRKNVFAQYKAARKINREASSIDWEEFWRIANLIREEIAEHLPFIVLQVAGAEADDIIATVIESTQEFGNYEDVMIVSADKDFIQLQKHSNVSQYSPMTKKLVTDKSPRKYLCEHILRGDSGDGVPNVLSLDDVFLKPELRQKPVTKKLLNHWIENFSQLDKVMDEATYRNFVRNRRCIDLSFIPDEIKEKIMHEYTNHKQVPNSKVFNYLIQKRCKLLVSCAAEFFHLK
jgi:5'-3' exonuclease